VHIVQPIRILNGKPVVFGEGNLISNQTSACCPAASQDGMIVLLTITVDSRGARVTLIRYVPIWVRHPDWASARPTVWSSASRADQDILPRPVLSHYRSPTLPGRGVAGVVFLRSAPGGKLCVVELLIAVNLDPDSKLPYLLRLPLAGGMVLRTSGTWPRTTGLYCYPVPAGEWPDDPEIVERLALRSCVRRSAAIDLVVDRGRENRSQLVFTTARGRDAVFWQSPRTRRQARPDVRTPTARAAGIPSLQIVVDSHEQYPYRFTGQQATTVKRALPCGDYAITAGGRLVASIERKSLTDLVPASLAASSATPWPSSPPCSGPRSWSRTATRPCSNLTGYARRWSLTG
jgi:hypothetical protein